MTLAQWFSARGWRPAKFQRELWAAMQRGESGLLHAPTGAGKTLAAWGAPLNLELKKPSSGLQLLWITPMRALAADTLKSLERPARELGLSIAIAKRTGDSSGAERARLKKRLPHTLITTPESLSLLLTYADVQAQLRSARWVIVDEWHELLGSKRGVQMELCLARLRQLNPLISVWGLSATIGNLQQALATLLGPQHRGRIVHAPDHKRVKIESLIPKALEPLPWSGHLGLKQLQAVLTQIRQAPSTLLFTNTRSQAELWNQALVACAPDIDEHIALHHGSLDRAHRDQVEAGLRDGRWRCVVATSSLDLGVDFSEVEQVIQVGSPKGIARLMQRAGRGGHRPDAVSRLWFVPTNSFELLEIVAARRAIAARAIEARVPLTLSLDVLAQHLVTLALGGGFNAAAVFSEVRSTHAFAALQYADFERVIRLISQGGEVLAHYPDYQKVTLHEGSYQVLSRRIALLHRLSIGTISSDGQMRVQMLRGAALGNIEEGFIARLKPGDRFVFAGKTLELQRVRELTAYVRLSPKRAANVPRWAGGNLPLSTELAAWMRALLASPVGPERELEALKPLLALQQARSCLPALDELLIERTVTREGQHWFCFPFAGRRVHEGMAALLAYRLSAARANTFSFSVNDYGFELLARHPLALDEPAFRALLTPHNLRSDLLASVNASELARRQFREIARVSGLVIEGRPGARKSTRQLQASAGLLFDTLLAHDPGHVLLELALSEVLERTLDEPELERTLARLQTQTFKIMLTERLTPLAFPLYADRLRGSMSTEAWSDRLSKLLVQHSA